MSRRSVHRIAWATLAGLAFLAGLPAALEELDRCAGTQFDPDVVAAAA
jgi:hypothetical protein